MYPLWALGLKSAQEAGENVSNAANNLPFIFRSAKYDLKKDLGDLKQ